LTCVKDDLDHDILKIPVIQPLVSLNNETASKVFTETYRVVLCKASHGMSHRVMQITARDHVFFIDAIGRDWELHTDFVRNFKVRFELHNRESP